MKKKVELLKEQEKEINEEMKQNDELGKRVAGELNNIIGLLLSLTQRMHRYEVLLQDIDLAEENGRDKRVSGFYNRETIMIRRLCFKWRQ